ncbi:MAG: hypothetical protein U0670_13115 [Anaerolineae bacterium]
MKRSRLVLTPMLLIAMISLFAVNVRAIANLSVHFLGTYDFETVDTCTAGNSWMPFTITGTGDTDDSFGTDVLAVITYDSGGTAIDVDVDGLTVGSTMTIPQYVDPGAGTLPDPALRPFTVVIYEVPKFTGVPQGENSPEAYVWILAHGTEQYRTTFDPTFDPACAQLPLVGVHGGSTTPVVGDLPFLTQAYWSPGNVSPGIFINPGTYWVFGVDSTGQYYKIQLANQYLWVPVRNMQPSYQSPWSGQPLPTGVVG